MKNKIINKMKHLELLYTEDGSTYKALPECRYEVIANFVLDIVNEQTCENCKYYTIKPSCFFCDNESSIAYMLQDGSLHKTDGCNKWEAKE